MKSIAEMKRELAAITPQPAKAEKSESNTVRDATVQAIGSALPVVKKGLTVTVKATGNFFSDIGTVYKYKNGLLDGTISETPAKEAKNVRTRAR